MLHHKNKDDSILKKYNTQGFREHWAVTQVPKVLLYRFFYLLVTNFEEF